jgi:D-3-phosphoglycerate dehydrogenase
MPDAGTHLNVAVTADFDERYLERLRDTADVRLGGWGVTGSVPPENELIDFLRGADVLVVAWEPITEAVLEAAPLRYIASVRGGPGGNVDLAAATRLGIPVTGTLGREAIPVAEFTFGLMIGLLRYIPRTYHMLRTGELASFDPPPPGDIGWGMEPGDPWLAFRGTDLAGLRLGLVGLGAVGRLVATRARAFEMEVIAHDPFTSPVEGVNLVPLDELMRTSDVVSVHARYSPQTHHLVDAGLISLMKPSAVLINTARPHLVDREALIRALSDGQIAGAALDVHGKEPINPDDPILALDNVICTPHIAGSSAGVTANQTRQVVENIERFARGEPLRHVANPEFAAAGQLRR